MTIADRIQSLRKSKGMSQEELADKVGVSRQAVSKWESEQATPDLDHLLVSYYPFQKHLGGLRPAFDMELYPVQHPGTQSER